MGPAGELDSGLQGREVTRPRPAENQRQPVGVLCRRLRGAQECLEVPLRPLARLSLLGAFGVAVVDLDQTAVKHALYVWKLQASSPSTPWTSSCHVRLQRSLVGGDWRLEIGGISPVTCRRPRLAAREAVKVRSWTRGHGRSGSHQQHA